MVYHPKPVIDMTPDGQFRSPRAAAPPYGLGRRSPLATRVALWAIVIAVVAGAGLLAALAAWLVFLLIPIVFVAGAVAYLAFRFQLWRASRARASSGPRDIFRP